jgi:hypothetical protein
VLPALYARFGRGEHVTREPIEANIRHDMKDHSRLERRRIPLVQTEQVSLLKNLFAGKRFAIQECS